LEKEGSPRICTYETDHELAKGIVLHILALSNWRKLIKYPKDNLINDIKEEKDNFRASIEKPNLS
jgi:hypothetical protein